MTKSIPRSRPATKSDIEEFANLIGGHCIRAEQQIADMEKHMEQWKDDLHDQVQAMLDQFRLDLDSANCDEVHIFKDRLHKVEQLLARLV